MKNISVFTLFICLNVATLLGQKIVSIGTFNLHIRGENIFSYSELGLYAKSPHPIEIYLKITHDSIFVSELQKERVDDVDYDMVFIYAAKRLDLDLSIMTTEPHDLIKEPTGLLKIVLSTKGLKSTIRMDAIYGKPKIKETMMVNGMRIITENNDQARRIMDQIKNL
jgi:hypothetical protein